jgi:hypothetical protein
MQENYKGNRLRAYSREYFFLTFKIIKEVFIKATTIKNAR